MSVYKLWLIIIACISVWVCICYDVLLGTSLSKNTFCQGRGMVIRNISKEYEDAFKNNKTETID